jgi:hypothetical protein
VIEKFLVLIDKIALYVREGEGSKEGNDNVIIDKGATYCPQSQRPPLEKIKASMAVPHGTLWVPSHWPLAPSVASVMSAG